MSREVLAVDVAVAVVLAALVLILSPGVAIVAIIALIALAVAGLSLLWSSLRGRRRRRTR